MESDFLDTVIASLADELHEIMESADGQRYAYVSDADLCALSMVDSNTALAVAAPMGSNMRVTSMCASLLSACPPCTRSTADHNRIVHAADKCRSAGG